MQKFKLEAVIFDMDGVLFDSEANWKLATDKANKKFNFNVDDEYRQSFCGMKEFEVRARLKLEHPELDADAYRDYVNKMVIKLMNKTPTKFYAVEILKSIKNKGVKLALATGSKNERMQKLFKTVKLDPKDIFTSILTGDDVKTGKPDPTIYVESCLKLNVKPANVLVIEDSPNGIVSASGAGCKPIFVPDLAVPSKEVEKLCYKTFKDLKQVNEFIMTLL